jgi:lipopolysaccharide transport system permease protein
MSVQIVTMGLVFGLIFKTEMKEYLPFLSTSIIIWGLIASSLNEGCMTFISAEPLIKQFRIGHLQHVIRVLWRNLLIAGHNFIILPFLFLFFNRGPDWSLVALFPGALVLILNLMWVIWLLGIISSRYRDLPPIVGSFVTIAFYLTPVMWYPTLIDNSHLAHLLLGLNPFYHWVQLVRLPILGAWPTLENWGLGLLSAGIGWFVTLNVYKKHKNMIAYWV